MISQEELHARLVELAEQLAALADEVCDKDSPQPARKVLEEVAAKRKQSRCLQCDREYSTTDKTAVVAYGGMGLCEECYQHTRYRINRKRDITRKELIELGLIAPQKYYDGAEKTPRQIAEEILRTAKKRRKK